MFGNFPLFSPENRAVYEKMWKNIVEPEKSQVTIWCKHIVCCIPKATNTHSEYVILIVFPLQQWLCEGTSKLRHTYIACLVSIRVWKSGTLSINGLLGWNIQMQLLCRRSSPHEHHSHTSVQVAVSVFHVLDSGSFTVIRFWKLFVEHSSSSCITCLMPWE